ncbi:MAG: LamG-like jellyroll fold domain-containing protein, partial [Candidatus Bathyarchaeia archaeon]
LNPEQEVVVGSSIQFTQTSIDPERDPLTYTWLLDGTVKANTQNWIYTPTTSEVGIRNVTLVVSDGLLIAKIQWNVTVIPNNPPTIIGYTPTIDYPCINQGQQQTFTVTATDPDGDPITYEWYLNNNLESTTDTYIFTASAGTSGTHTITVIVKDSHGAQTSRKWYLTVDANLVMPFDTSTAPAIDYAGTQNNGTVYGATWTPDGKVGGAYIFSGSSYIEIADHPELGGDGTWTEITIEFWIYLTQDQWGSRIVAKRGTTSARSYQVGIQSASSSTLPNRLYFGVWNRATSPVYYEVEIATPLNINTWYHVVCTYKSTVGSKIYINGIEVAINVKSGQNTGNIQSSSGQPLYIGRGTGSDGTFTYLIGILDEVRIYPKALTADQISRSYNQMMSLYEGEGLNIYENQPAQQGLITVQATLTVPLICAAIILSKKRRKTLLSQLSSHFFIAK